MESVSEALLNAFTKVKKPDPKFTEILQTMEVLDENMTAIDKNYTRLVKVYEEMSTEFNQMGASATALSSSDSALTDIMTVWSRACEATGTSLKTLVCGEW